MGTHGRAIVATSQMAQVWTVTVFALATWCMGPAQCVGDATDGEVTPQSSLDEARALWEAAQFDEAWGVVVKMASTAEASAQARCDAWLLRGFFCEDLGRWPEATEAYASAAVAASQMGDAQRLAKAVVGARRCLGAAGPRLRAVQQLPEAGDLTPEVLTEIADASWLHEARESQR